MLKTWLVIYISFISFFCLISRSGSLGQQFEQGDPDVPLPGHFHTKMLRCNLSSVSWVCPGVSSRLDMPETPPQGDVQEASRPDA